MAEKMEEIKILSDNPEEESEKIKFDFLAYIKTFEDIITGSQNKTPLVIGLEGRWGRGKTTLMKALRGRLKDKDKKKNKDGRRRCKTVWFQAWKYNDADNLLAALLEEIVQEMERGNFFEKAQIGITKVWKKLNIKALPDIFSNYLPFLKGISKIVKEEDYKKSLPYFNLFSSFLEQLIRLWINAEDTLKLTEAEDFTPGKIDDKKGVLVVFIDDLDRCNDENIIKVLEAIKLFPDFKGCVFVMGVSREVIIKALSSSPHIGKEYASEYLEKMIQVSYELPKIHEGDMTGYFEEIVQPFSDKEILIKYSEPIVKSLGDTPRKLKKFINNLNLQIKIAEHKGIFDKKKIEKKDYIYWNILKEAFEKKHFEAIQINPKIVGETKKGYEKHKEDLENNRFDNIEKIPYEPVRNFLKKESLRNIILNLPDNSEKIETLIYESMAVARLQSVKEEKEEFRKPSIGEIVKVEKGPFLYGDEKDKKDLKEDFEIDVFPVTNEEYCQFLNNNLPEEENFTKWIYFGGKYGKERCRIKKEGKKYIVEEGYKRFPVIYVTLYGADAYAKSVGKRLPTEEEWEKTARGPEGWIYPWGDKFDPSLCNSNESKIGGTSPVDKFPKGKSYYGCYDMAGNVWEWTDSWYDDSKDTKVLRGGSWNNAGIICRCADRTRDEPDPGFNNIGFRCARTV